MTQERGERDVVNDLSWLHDPERKEFITTCDVIVIAGMIAMNYDAEQQSDYIKKLYDHTTLQMEAARRVREKTDYIQTLNSCDKFAKRVKLTRAIMVLLIEYCNITDV